MTRRAFGTCGRTISIPAPSTLDVEQYSSRNLWHLRSSSIHPDSTFATCGRAVQFRHSRSSRVLYALALLFHRHSASTRFPLLLFVHLPREKRSPLWGAGGGHWPSLSLACRENWSCSYTRRSAESQLIKQSQRHATYCTYFSRLYLLPGHPLSQTSLYDLLAPLRPNVTMQSSVYILTSSVGLNSIVRHSASSQALFSRRHRQERPKSTIILACASNSLRHCASHRRPSDHRSTGFCAIWGCISSSSSSRRPSDLPYQSSFGLRTWHRTKTPLRFPLVNFCDLPPPSGASNR